MADTGKCPSCGTDVTEAALRGLCPKCLAREAGLLPDRTAFLGSGLPRTFGDYELLEELGRGGMGIVYKARQKSLNRTVAVKMLVDGPLANLATAGRFRSEAEAAAQLRHPNIAAIYEIGEQDGLLYFSMDYVTGVSLADLARNQLLSVETSVRLVQTIAETIQFAHQRGTIHRDLKPSNIIVDEQGKPHILDFGLAKRVEAQRNFTLTGQSLGSPGFAPPEQVDGKRGSIGVWSDIYGLGAILYFLLTGRPPFAGSSLTDTFYQTLHEPPVPPSSLNPAVTHVLEGICLKCLAKEPTNRYASAADLAMELAKAISNRTSNNMSPPELKKQFTVRESRSAASLILLGLLVVIVVAAVWLWPWRASQNPPSDKQTTTRGSPNSTPPSQLSAEERSLLERVKQPGETNIWMSPFLAIREAGRKPSYATLERMMAPDVYGLNAIYVFLRQATNASGEAMIRAANGPGVMQGAVPIDWYFDAQIKITLTNCQQLLRRVVPVLLKAGELEQ